MSDLQLILFVAVFAVIIYLGYQLIFGKPKRKNDSLASVTEGNI